MGVFHKQWRIQGGGVSAAGSRPPIFEKNTLKSPLNWLKFSSPRRPPSSDPGSATDKNSDW